MNLQRYRPEIWSPESKPLPVMAEDTANGAYYAKDDVDDVVRQLRQGLKAAHEWLSGWASAAPYIDTIERILADTAGSEDQPGDDRAV